MEQRLWRIYTRGEIAFGTPNPPGWFNSLCAVAATTVLKSALVGAGPACDLFSGIFRFILYSFLCV